MGVCELSAAAAEDLAEIAEFTMLQFGLEQSRRYRDGLQSCFEALAENPQIGRAVPELGAGLRRFPHQAHVVFYRPQEGGVLIARVLHPSRDVNPELLRVLAAQRSSDDG
jgi:toxin ParE1/3/4